MDVEKNRVSLVCLKGRKRMGKELVEELDEIVSDRDGRP